MATPGTDGNKKMTDSEIEASAWKAGGLVALTTAVAAKLLLIDNYPERPSLDILITIALFAVCVGVVTGAGCARLLKVLEERRRSAAEAAAVAERQAKALEAVARHGSELRRIVPLIEDGALSWGSAVARGVPRTVVQYDDDVYAELKGQPRRRAWMRAIQSGADLLAADGRPLEPGLCVEGGTVRVLEPSDGADVIAIRTSSRSYLVVNGQLQGTSFTVKKITALTAEEARQRGISLM